MLHRSGPAPSPPSCPSADFLSRAVRLLRVLQPKHDQPVRARSAEHCRLRCTLTPASATIRWATKDIQGRKLVDFIHNDDRAALKTLLDDATAGPPPRLPGVSARLRHSAAMGGFHTVEVKACYDEDLVYLVMLDATEPARLEVRSWMVRRRKLKRNMRSAGISARVPPDDLSRLADAVP